MKRILLGLAILITLTGTTSAFGNNCNTKIDWNNSEKKDDNWNTD